MYCVFSKYLIVVLVSMEVVNKSISHFIKFLYPFKEKSFVCRDRVSTEV